MAEETLESIIEKSRSSGQLNLYDQGLISFPDIFDIPNITWIYMSNNKISRIPNDIRKLTRLNKLQLGNNSIIEIPKAITSLTSLTSLNLSNNNINEIPEYLCELTQLTVLDLSNNNIKRLPLSFSNLTNLRGLELDGNPIEFPPPEIVGRGFDAIVTYLDKYKEQNAEGELVNEAKLLLVGQGGVGKTSLANRFVNSEFDDSEETTKGISIQVMKLKSQKLKGGDIKLNIWDFGGQEIYHSTHQFFLTKRSIYILVWDSRQEEEYGRLDYWLRTIQAFSENSPVIIVLNKVDERDKEINLRYLKEEFPQIVNYYKISCKNGEGIDELKNKLLRVAEKLPLMETFWFHSWLKVRNVLESDGRNYIAHSEYLTICYKFGVMDREADTLSDYLHDLGVILHFRNDEILKNVVILNPSWGTNAVYRILDDQETIYNKGVFFINELDRILDERSGYPTETHSIILKLMSNFELSFPLYDLRAHLVAELLPRLSPKFSLKNEWNTIKFEYSYSFMPAGIISRFIVRCHDKLMSLGNERLYWREGAYLCYENSFAKVESFPKQGKIQISIEGEDPRDFLSIVRSHFGEINKSFRNIQINEYIPCKCEDGCTYLHDFKVLKRRYLKSIYIDRCLLSDKEVSIPSLLNGIDYNYSSTPPNDSHINIVLSQNMEAVQSQNIDINIDIYNEITSIQNILFDLTSILSDFHPAASKEIEKIEEELFNIDLNGMGKSSLSQSPFNRIRRLIAKMLKKGDDVNDLLSKTKKGIELAQELGKKYNKVASWIGMPSIPEALL